jgi:hypothetical protein
LALGFVRPLRVYPIFGLLCSLECGAAVATANGARVALGRSSGWGWEDGGAGKTKQNVWFALVLFLLENDAMSTLAVLFLRTISK